MKISSVSGINGKISLAGIKKSSTAGKVSSDVNTKSMYLQISFAGNPDKNPNQIIAFSPETNYLGKIYRAGGEGDVGEALPDSIAKHGKVVSGNKEDIDIRTIIPYYSLDNSDGYLYVAKKETVEKIKKGEPVYYKVNGKEADFKYADINYQLQEGESFALLSESKDGSKVNKVHLLDDTGISSDVERVKRDSLEMEKVPYRLFKLDAPDRKDIWYVLYTPEMASGKSAYGIYQKYNNNSDGTTAYGGTSAYGATTAYGAATSGHKKNDINFVEQAIKDNKFVLKGTTAGDMFFTEQVRAMEQCLEKLAEKENFNPQNIILHDRFSYVFLSDAFQKAKDGDRFYQGLRVVPIFHNPGRDKQGVYANPIDFFRVVADKKDIEALHNNENYEKISKISKRISEGKATAQESAAVYNFFKGYFPNFIDDMGTFNMTMIPISAARLQPDNVKPGNVSKFFGLETRNLPDIALGLTDKLEEIESNTIDVVNGAKPANMAPDKQDGFFGSGTLNDIFKNTNDERHYVPFKTTDPTYVIFDAKQSNKKNLINIVSEATKQIQDGDSDAIAKVFLGEKIRNDIREQAQDKNLPLTLGGFSDYKEGDILMISWGRPDPQKGLVTTLAAFRDTLKDETIPLETRKHLKLIMGAGGGNDAFSGQNNEWTNIQKIMKEISEIEINGEKGIFKNNALYVNGLFPNRIANCADLSIFTSRYEPCGITPFESFATGTPVISIKTGGAPDFIKDGHNGFLTHSAFMVSNDVLQLSDKPTYEEIDSARIERSAKEIRDTLKNKYLAPFMKEGSEEEKYSEFKGNQLKLMENCLSQKIEWHNNNEYNGGRSALDIYLHDKCRTQDNDVNDTPVTSLRGAFNDSALDIPAPISSDPFTNKDEVKQETNKNKTKDTGSIAKVIAPLVAVIASAVFFIKTKLDANKQKNENKDSFVKQKSPAKTVKSSNINVHK